MIVPWDYESTKQRYVKVTKCWC